MSTSHNTKNVFEETNDSLDGKMDRKTIKTICIDAMKKMRMGHRYIDDFEKEDVVYIYRGDSAYKISPHSNVYYIPQIHHKMKEIEESYTVTVYAVIYDIIMRNELYSFLVVCNSKNDWEFYSKCPINYKDKFYTLACVWNSTENFGECGETSFVRSSPRGHLNRGDYC